MSFIEMIFWLKINKSFTQADLQWFIFAWFIDSRYNVTHNFSTLVKPIECLLTVSKPNILQIPDIGE